LSWFVFFACLSFQKCFQITDKFRAQIAILMAAANESSFEIRKMIRQVFRSRIRLAEKPSTGTWLERNSASVTFKALKL